MIYPDKVILNDNECFPFRKEDLEKLMTYVGESEMIEFAYGESKNQKIITMWHLLDKLTFWARVKYANGIEDEVLAECEEFLRIEKENKRWV